MHALYADWLPELCVTRILNNIQTGRSGWCLYLHVGGLYSVIHFGIDTYIHQYSQRRQLASSLMNIFTSILCISMYLEVKTEEHASPAWAWGNSLLWQRLYLLRNSRHRTVGSQTIKMMRKSLETEPSRWSGPVNNKMNESCVNIMEF